MAAVMALAIRQQLAELGFREKVVFDEKAADAFLLRALKEQQGLDLKRFEQSEADGGGAEAVGNPGVAQDPADVAFAEPAPAAGDGAAGGALAPVPGNRFDQCRIGDHEEVPLPLCQFLPVYLLFP